MVKECIYALVVLFILNLIVASCAQISAPIGGVKDSIPPKLIRSVPVNYSGNYKEKNLVLEFDEYFTMKNIQQQLVISPPMKEKPKIILKSKKLIIDLKNDLKDSTTYTLNFGDAIMDLHENNPLKDFEFVFSTGNVVDSLLFKGKILNAFDHKPVENMLVMLYKNYSDSTPVKQIPDFYDKTDKMGVFSIRNIASAKYRIFALKDVNANYLFDKPNEEIAYLDTLIIPSAKFSQFTDTIKVTKKNAVSSDSLVKRYKTVFFPDTLMLYSFQEDTKKQYIAGNNRPEKMRCVLAFGRPVKTEVKMKLLNNLASAPYFTLEQNLMKDSLTYWLNDSLIYNADSLQWQVSYEKLDSLKRPYTEVDTIVFKYSKKQETEPTDKKSDKGKRNTKLQEANTKIIKNKRVSCDIESAKTLNLGENIVLQTPYPLVKFNLSGIKLWELKKDTVYKELKFKIIPDSALIRKFFISSDWKEDTKYRLLMDTTAVADIYSNAYDTLKVDFITRKEADYATLILEIIDLAEPVVLQIIEEPSRIAKVLYIDKPQKMKINYLNPGKYRLKMLFDPNRNRNWDTGNYLKNVQPEKVLFYNGEVTAKVNFDLVIRWNVKGQ
jgi:hypothetical protein